MKVRLFLAERANIPTYDHAKDRAIEGEWERGWQHIEVPLREGEHNPQLQAYHGDIEGPICVPLAACQWWAPLRMIRAAEPDLVGVDGPVEAGPIPNEPAPKRGKR